jgi:hypothetical protein
MVKSRAFRGGTLFLALVGLGWLAARLASGHAGSAGSIPPAADPAIAPAFASVRVPAHSRLTTTARSKLPTRTADTAEILVLLDSADIRACEDLGRQLRELRNRAGPAMSLVVLADSAAMMGIRTFARRERLRATGFVALGSRDVMTGEAHVPTPAVLVVRGSEVIAGVSHPRRFSNVRIRSFADELSAYLPGTSGSAVSRDTGRLQ